MVGMVALVTVSSFQAEVTGEMLTVPSTLMRLMKTVMVAFVTWLEVVPAGRELRSNWMSEVLPLPMSRLDSVPKLVVVREVLTNVSPETVPVVAWAAEGDRSAAKATAGRKQYRVANMRMFDERRFKASSCGCL